MSTLISANETPAALEPCRWQAAFDASAALFEPLADGARMGLIAQDGKEIAGRRRAALDAAGASYAGRPMLAFAAAQGRIAVTVERFESFAAARLDLLFVAGEAARTELAGTPARGTLLAMKRLIRRGDVLFFVLRARDELRAAGYEEFLESLGIPFLGSCR